MKTFKFLIFIILVAFISTENIMREPNFPIFITPNRHSVDQTTSVEFRFQLPTRTMGKNTAGGLEFNQFFALRFQDSVFIFTSNLPTCTIMVGTTTYKSQSFASENAAFSNVNSNSNYFFCKLTDTVNSRIMANTTITLTLNFSNQITTRYISNVSLYTTTSNNVDMMIIDSLPNFGSIGLYNNYLTSTNNKFMRITSNTQNLAYITAPSTTSNILYPNFTFDLKFNLQIGQLFNFDPEDVLVILHYDTISFSTPTSVASEALSTLNDEKALSGPLSLTELSGRGVIIEGFLKQDLYDGRKVRISLSGMKSNDKQILKRTEIELLLFYRNTYSIISHSTLNMDIVNRVLMSNVSVHHPEYFYMYDGMGWPFQFNFKFQSDLPDGGWVVIRQKGYDIKTASVVLIASSCDFSETSLEQSYGKRWNCFPLRNDFKYDQSSGDVTAEGQGIYFRLPTIQSSIELYKIKIWGFIDKCMVSTATTKHMAQSLTFSIRVFKFAFQNNTLLNEGIFFGNTANYILAETFTTLVDGCFPLQTRSQSVRSTAITTVTALLNPDVNKIPGVKDTNFTGTANAAAEITSQPVGIEITNFNLFKPPSTISNLTDYSVTGSTYFNYNGKHTDSAHLTLSPTTAELSSVFVKKYLYSTATDIAGSNLFLIAIIPTVRFGNFGNGVLTNEADLRHYVPSECRELLIHTDATNTGYLKSSDIVEPRIQFLFSRQFLTQGTAMTASGGCSIGWSYYTSLTGAPRVDATEHIHRFQSLVLDTTTGALTLYRIRTIITSASQAVAGQTTVDDYKYPANMDLNLSKIDTSASATGTNLKYTITSNTFSLAPISSTEKTQRTLSLTSVVALLDDAVPTPFINTNVVKAADHCAPIIHDFRIEATPSLTKSTAVAGIGPALNTGFNRHSVSFAIHSSCFNVGVIPSTVKTLNTYFEAQMILLSYGKYPFRVSRFIKLFPEIGLFHDNADVATNSSIAVAAETTDTWMSATYQVTTNSSSPFAVCVLEINSYFIDNLRGTSNTLVIWMFATSLLDVDINDVSSEYPVAPLPSATAYGLNSGQTMSLGFRRISDVNARTGLTITEGQVYPTKVISTGAVNVNYWSEFEHYFYEVVCGISLATDTTAANGDRAYSSSATATNKKGYAGFTTTRNTLYHMYLGSIIIIPSLSSSPTGNTTDVYNNMFIPFLCPQTGDDRSGYEYPSNPVYFTHPIVTIGWMTTDKYNSISRLNKYVFSTTVGRTLSNADYMNVVGFNSVHIPILRYSGLINTYAVAVTNAMSRVRDIFVQFNTTDNVLDTRDKSLLEMEARFLRYNLTTDNNDKRLVLRLASNDATISTYVSAVSLFLSSKITSISNPVTHDIPTHYTTNNFKQKTMNSNVFILGKPFNKYLVFSDFNDIEAAPTSTPPTVVKGRIVQRVSITSSATGNLDSFSIIKNKDYKIEGIQRPSLDALDSDIAINPLNFIAIFMSSRSNFCYDTDLPVKGASVATSCGAAAAGTPWNMNVYKMYSNLKTNGVEVTSFNNFILWHPDNFQSTWSASIQADTQYVATTENKGANIRIAATLPSEIPIGSSIDLTFSGTIIQQNLTKCGLVENSINNIVTECSVTTGIITCKTTKRATALDVCCYNIYDNGTPTTTLELSTGKVNLNNSLPASIVNAYPISWYEDPVTGTNNKMATLTFTSRKIENISDSTSSFYAKLERIRYNFSTTNGGLGLAIFDINLPRNAVRGMILEINADLSNMKILNVPARVVPSFGSSELFGFNSDLGDLFLDSVFTNLDSNGIKLRLKNIIYKCRVGLTNNLSLYIWPVLTQLYTSLSVSINMKANDNSSLASNGKHSVPSPTMTYSAPLITTISQTFFTISNIEPKIVDEIASYNFNFNFNQFSSNLENETANEIVLFLPHLYYGEYPNLICYNGTTLLQCNFLYKSILSIRFNGNISLTGDSAIVIKIVGIRNPFLPSNNGVYFACSINRTNFSTDDRRTILRGITTISEGILFNAGVVFGNLIFRNKFCFHTFTTSTVNNSLQTTNNSSQGFEIAEQEPLNPRENPRLVNDRYVSLHQFGITLDIANNNISNWDNGYTIDKSPVLYINFPHDYRFHWHSFTPIAEVEWYNISEIDFKVVSKVSNKLTINTISLIGNTIKITFNQTSISFTRFFSHFLVKLYNLPTPNESTINTATNRITTERFEFLLVNSDNSIIFKTWSNLNNFSNQNILVNRPNLLLAKHKGFRFEYDQKKYIIDVINKTNNSFNNITIKSGTFNKYSYKVRATSRLLRPALVNLVLDTQTITYDKPFYTVSSALKSDTEFLIGVACNTNPGIDIVRTNFISSSQSNAYNSFLPLSPLIVNIITSEKTNITFTNNNIVRINGSLFVDFSVLEATFENLSILFTPASESLIENAVILKGTTTIRTTFKITNSAAVAIQSFTLGTPTNSCFKYMHDKINFTIDGVAAIIPNDAIKRSMFEYRNSDNDNTLPKSSIRFIFTTEYTQIYVYANLICFNDEFPTDDQLKNQNITQSPKSRYFSEILNIQGNANIIFNNLLRGVEYKLKILIESTQGDKSLRTSSKLEIFNQTLSNGTTIPIIAARTLRPLCASFRFNTRPGVQVTDPLLWYWQDRFSGIGYYETGCISIVDQYGTEIPGLPVIKNETSCGRQNCRFINRESFVVNQTALDISETYTLCAYQFSTCTVDPSNYQEIFNELLTIFATNSTMNTALDTKVVPQFSVSTVGNTNSLVTPTISNISFTAGRLTFNAVSTSPLQCFVRVSNTQPLTTDFDNCNTGCTTINTSSVQGSFSINLGSGISGSQNIYSVCYNDSPCSSSRSSVSNFGSFTASTNNNINNNSTNNNTNNNNTSNMNKMYEIKMLILLIIVLLYLN